ncbi:hypothetical protein [Fimbriimonas ginsengisoli]|uniref:VWFA domain-containing protein n=1 Tax=Fimbriimonas ginsengisoli Gsoil 348 TaxID=661478 RepID=A0A068NX82_FIMGI|nr:hypothetical protein [Fimbriimonas ginsengisoli]AIE88036.1 hypothetical protein OP10G_4668 [Fimbriimonas ginsengisoli Gsoil 348]
MPKKVLFGVLFVAATVPLFFDIAVPNEPVDASIDFYSNLMKLPEGSKVLVGSDWTTSTRGESGGEMDALLRILMRKKIKFCVYSTGDAQAPQVARDNIVRIAKEVAADGGQLYKPFQDYVIAGYFPNSEGTTLAINNNIKAAFAGRKDMPEGGRATDVTSSPVFDGITSLADFKYLVLVTASGTNNVTLERIKKTPLMFMVTGVMVPENTVYYSSGQLKGLCGGVKGVYDLETLMEKGTPDKTVPPLEGTDKLKKDKMLKGTAYYPTLHVCLFLLIFALFVGNLGMVLGRKERAK